MPDPDWILLTESPLDPAAAIACVTDPAAGGIDLFLGITRAAADPAKGDLLALDYDAYPEMAHTQIRAMLAQARARWPICKCAILHRTGRVAIGQASVIIAVSCPHRGEAFDACRYLIDTLKSMAPIWKNDIFTQGTAWHHDPQRGPVTQ